MQELRTEIEVEARPERVWEILTDFPAYPEWNPFIRSIEGKGLARLEARGRIGPPGGRGMTFKPTVLEATPKQEPDWLARVFAPHLP